MTAIATIQGIHRFFIEDPCPSSAKVRSSTIDYFFPRSVVVTDGGSFESPEEELNIGSILAKLVSHGIQLATGLQLRLYLISMFGLTLVTNQHSSQAIYTVCWPACVMWRTTLVPKDHTLTIIIDKQSSKACSAVVNCLSGSKVQTPTRDRLNQSDHTNQII